MKKKLLIALVAVVLVIGVALAGASCYLVNFAIVRTDNPPDVSPESVVTDENASVIDVNRETIDAQTEAWLSGAEAERVEITSDDGLNLVGEMYRIDGSHKWLHEQQGELPQPRRLLRRARLQRAPARHARPRRERGHLHRHGLARPDGRAEVDRHNRRD